MVLAIQARSLCGAIRHLFGLWQRRPVCARQATIARMLVFLLFRDCLGLSVSELAVYVGRWAVGSNCELVGVRRDNLRYEAALQARCCPGSGTVPFG